MRILIINQPFYPDVVATAQHMTDLASHLVARGHTVSVIASRSVYGQSGAILPKREIHNGIHIYRVGANLFRKGRTITRIIDFGLFHCRALCRALTLPRQDVVICLTTPPFIGIVGRWVKILRWSKYVQYEMDLYPDISIALGVTRPRSFAAWYCRRLHRKLLRSAARVVVLGRCMRRVIAAKGIPDEKLVLVTPWADPDEIRPVAQDANPFRTANGLAGKFVVMYAGNLGLGHDIGTILAAMERLKTDDRVRFVFVGGGRRMEEIGKAIREKGLAHVLILDYVPRESLGQMLSAADVHLITQAANTSGLIVPSKFYGILAAGRPSIYIGPADTEIALTIQEENVGEVLAIGDVAGFLAAIDQRLQKPEPDMAARCRNALEKGHTRAQCVELLARMLESLSP